MQSNADTDIDYLSARQLIRSPGSGLAGILILSLSLLIAAGIGWAAWADVDEVVNAQGQVQPAGKAKIINHQHGGKVADIFVQDGTFVTRGDRLITLDAEADEAQRAELLGSWQVHAFEVERLKAEAEGSELDPMIDLAVIRPDLLDAEQALMSARQEAILARAFSRSKVIETRDEDLRSAVAELGRIENSLRLLEQQFTAVNELYERGLYPKLKLVALERQISDARGERHKASAALAGARAALAEAESQKTTDEKEWRRDLLTELGRATAERDQIWERLQKQSSLLNGLTVTAPIDGIIQELMLTTPGQSVAANAPIMKLVPLGDDLVVQADVANDDISKIKTGMKVAIKVRAYDFLRYGALAGKVEQIAQDSHLGIDGESLNYRVRISTEISKHKGELKIQPGMQVNVELKVGSRTILAYLTDRIVEWRDQAFTDS